MRDKINVLIIGAGPAGLAAAIALKKLLNQNGRHESVVVIEKAAKLGYHTLSGAVFEGACLDELLGDDWAKKDSSAIANMVQIQKDDLYFLHAKGALKIPDILVPKSMHHKGDYALSLGQLVDFLGQKATELGVEIYTGFAAKSLIIEDGRVCGVKLVELGLNKEGNPKENYLAGEQILADVTLLCDGSRGVLSTQLIKTFPAQSNPQIYSIGVKQLIKLPPNNQFGDNRAIHMLGHPIPRGVFGGGFMYSMAQNVVAIGLILGLDWQYQNLNPQQELEILKQHPFIATLIDKGQVLITGVKTIPEGGYYSLPQLYSDGVLLLGDAAGFVNMEKIKGIHYAIRSGMAAADAVWQAMTKGDYSQANLAIYKQNLEQRGILPELYHARNFRQSFKFGTFVGAALSKIQAFLPFKLGMEEDHRSMKEGLLLERSPATGMDRAQFVSHSGTVHREDEPSHIKIIDATVCVACSERFGNPCMHFCPGEVYRMKGEEMILSPSNCLHDASCQVKCPLQNVIWTPPEGGEGPKFKRM